MASAKAKLVLVSVLAGILAAGAVGVAVVMSCRLADVARIPTVTGNVAPASPWTVTFSDGSTVNLLGLTDAPGSGTWWAADGTVTPAPAQLPRAFYMVLPSDSTRHYYLVVRHDSPALRDAYLNVTVRQRHLDYELSIQRIGPNAEVTGRGFTLPKDLPVFDLVLMHASGPWQVGDHHDLRSAPAPGPDDTQNPEFSVLSVTEEGGSVAVETSRTRLTDPASFGDYQLFVVSSADGKEHASNKLVVKPNGAIVYSFPVRKDQATTLVHRWRPFEIREIHNVSLRPGTKTDVTVQQREAKK